MGFKRNTLAPLLCTLLLMLLSSATLACNAPLRVALFDFPPFYSPDKGGQPQGLLIDQIDQLLGDLGCSWQGRFYTAPQLLENIVDGDSDLAMIIHHPLLIEKAHYSDHPISQMVLTSYRLPQTEPIQAFEQLKGKRVIAIRGYGYGGLFEQLIDPKMGAELHFASDHEAGLKMLERQRGDYLLGYRKPAQNAIEALQISDIEANPIRSWDIYLVLSPHYADPNLLQRLDERLKP